MKTRSSLPFLWVLFVLLPGALLTVGLKTGANLYRLDCIRSTTQEVSREARTILSGALERTYIQDRFRNPENGAPPPREEIVFRPDLSPASAAVFQPLIEFLRNGREPSQEEFSDLRDILGWQFDLFRTREKPSVPIPVMWGSRKAFLIWANEPSKGSVQSGIHLRLVFPPTSWNLLRKSFQASVGRIHKGGVVDLSSKRWEKAKGTSMKDLRDALFLLEKRNQNTSIKPGSVVWAANFGPSMSLFLERALPIPARAIGPMTLACVLLLSLGLGTIGFLSLRSRVPDWPLRAKIAGLFAFIFLVPGSAISILFFGLLSDREQVLEQEAMRRAGENLLAFDEDFLEEERLCDRVFNSLLEHPTLKAGDFEAFRNHVRKLMAGDLVEYVEIRDWESSFLFQEGIIRKDTAMERLNRMISDRGISHHLNKPPSESISPKDAVAWTILENPEMGYLDFLKKPGTAQRFQFGNNRFYQFWKVLPQKPESRVAFGFVSRLHEQAAIHYLKGTLVRNRETRIFARERISGKWFPHPPSSRRALDELCEGISNSGQDQNTTILFKGSPHLVVGIPALRLFGFDLLALVPRDSFMRDLGELRRLVWIAFLAAFSVGVAATLYLARGILRPISDLMAGISRFGKGLYSDPIEIRGQDELARLAGAFNHLLEATQELNLAREVQDTLLPKIFSPPPGYEIRFLSRMSEIVGGDYLDCFPAGPDGIAMMVGDVSGHGISSALVMAMAKTVVSEHFRAKDRPEKLLDTMNRTLYDLTLERQMMAFSFCWIDCTTHTGRVTLGGAPQAILFEAATGGITQVGIPHYPLGITLKQQYRISEVPVRLGDILLIYTDGLVGALDPQDRSFGYDTFFETVRKNGHLPLNEFTRVIEEAVLNHTRGRPLPDDFSLIAVKRSSDPPPAQPPQEEVEEA